MAHTPVQPSGSVQEQNLSELTEFYVCAAGDSLSSGHLLAQTSGDLNAAPTRTVTRTLLHNLTDIVSVGALQAQAFDVQAFLPESDSVMASVMQAFDDGSNMKFNAFHRDGSGWKGWAKVATVVSATTPDQPFAKTITFEPFNVERIPAP